MVGGGVLPAIDPVAAAYRVGLQYIKSEVNHSNLSDG